MPPDPTLVACSWSLWAVSLVFVLARFTSRRLSLGSFRMFQADDYLMLVTVVTLTGVVVTSNQVAQNGSNYETDEVIATWTDKQKADAEWGSKMLLALEQFMLATLWLVKAGLLILYRRMTDGLNERIVVRVIAGYCLVGYIVIQVLYLGVWCRPIYDYWAVPVPAGHDQCRTYHKHMITVTVIHVTSDLAMLFVPIPLVARARLPLKRKLVLCGVFSLGVLVVIVAILNRYYNFTVPNSLIFLNWYNGEASTAVMIANIPLCWTLLRRLFALDAWGQSSAKRSWVSPGPPTIGHAVMHRPQQRDVDLSMSALGANDSTEYITGNRSQYELQLGAEPGCGGGDGGGGGTPTKTKSMQDMKDCELGHGH